MSIQLAFIKGAQKGKTVSLDGTFVCILGRAQDCNIIIGNAEISRYHCLIEYAKGKLILRDFGSLNGTYLNKALIGKRPEGMSQEEAIAKRYNEVEVRNGDVLSLGSACDIRIEIKQEMKQEIKGGPDRVSPGQKAQKLEKGDIIPGYQQIKVIGEGGMGTVYLVKERKTGRQMALKTIRKDKTQEGAAFDRFVREARLGGQLDSEYIVKQHDAGIFDGMPYILMDYYPYGALMSYRSLFTQPDKIKYKEAVRLLIEILKGLDYLHNASLQVELKNGATQTVNGIVHRDLKPANIFMTREEKGIPHIKIADFGLSKAYEVAGLTGNTMTGSVMGTLYFMPKQQILQTKYAKPEVDVWAAAASIYFMLTGRPPKPFDGKTDDIVCILKKSAVPVRTFDPNVPLAFAKVLDKALQDISGIPYQTAAELIADLKSVYAAM